MFKVISFNANGIRSAARKGFFDWFKHQEADVLCLQETKAQEHQLKESLYLPEGYYPYFFDAKKPGYSGVAIYTKRKPDQVHYGMGLPFADEEGRYIQADFEDISIVSIYLPSGSSGEIRQALKFKFMEFYEKLLAQQIKNQRRYIICGDWNIVHREIDIKNFKSNQTSSGCLPEERRWLDKVIHEIGFVDAFRVLNQQANEYTWWSHRGQARAKNVGWRIDYQMISPALKPCLKSVSIYREEFFSDHAPVIAEYEILE
ncbi:MAG: exodeoxyribonuclease III [Gammaproteobacteria bacterium]|nr:exodeoxyribonuclease III [Gammaproteobacteria bacterium]